MFSLGMQLTTKKASWLDNPSKRIDAGFVRAGFNFRQGLSRSQYPAVPPGSRYKRTYATADKANYQITIPGKEMKFGSTFYLPYLLFPSRKGRGPLWSGKLEFLVKMMIAGFKSGFKDFKDE